MKHLNPWRLAILLSGSRGEFVVVSFSTDGRLMHAAVPSNELWISVKDVLVIEEYELDRDFSPERISPQSTVVDAGAFAGLFSLKVSPHAGKVIAFEASRRNFAILAHNLASNSITNVEAHWCALSSARGKVPFRDVETHSSSSLAEHGVENSYEVESMTLDDVVDKYGSIDLLKMDIEGAEYGALLSVSQPNLLKISRIVAEMHLSSIEDQVRFREVLGLLLNSGMRVRTLQSRKKGLRYGMIRPWRCSLKRVNGKSTLPFRVLVAAVYAFASIASRIKWSYDERPTILLFASRDKVVSEPTLKHPRNE